MLGQSDQLDKPYSICFAYAVLCALVGLFVFPQRADADPGVSKTRVLIGYSSDLTGIAAVSAVKYRKGADVYFDTVNSKGGVHGRKIKVIYYDDGYEPKVAYENVKRLIEQDKVFAIFQNYGSESALEVLPLIEKYNIPFIAPIGSNEIIRTSPSQRDIFYVRMSSGKAMNGLVNYAIQKLGIKKFAILAQDDGYGLDIREGALKAMRSLGIKPVLDERFARKASSLVSIVDDLIQSKAEAVILGIQNNATARLIENAAKKKFHPIYLGPVIYGSKDFYQKVERFAPKIYFASSFPVIEPRNMKMPVIQEFLEAIKNTPAEPDTQTFEGYFNAKVFTHALQLAGKNPTRKLLIEALQSLRNFDFGGITVDFSETSHEGIKKFYIGTFKDGRTFEIQ